MNGLMDFIGQMNKAGGAGLKGDLAGFGKGLKGAVAALAGWAADSFIRRGHDPITVRKIFTVAGDLVQTIEHDGRGGFGEATWNLISRNGQEVVSGIYLYVVQSDDDSFEDFIGKFVVVR